LLSRHRYSTALVTGASSGIGHSFATELAARGADVIVVARRKDRLDSLATKLRATYGVAVEVLPADLTNPAELTRVEERLADLDMPVDLIVNNAALSTTGDFADLSVDGEDAQVRLNVLAMVRLTHAVLPTMISRHHGGVLNVSSITALTPCPGHATYAATKAFIASFTESLRTEVKGEGVHVTLLLPGFTHTERFTVGGVRHVKLPDFIWLQPDRVAHEGLDAVEASRTRHIPGVPNKIAAVSIRVVPRSVPTAISAKLWKPRGEIVGS
jgi:uncharacterized protein